MRFGTKWLDLEAQALRDDEGNEHPLTASEFGLLKVFAANPKRVLSRERLLELANARDAEAFDRAVDLRIMRIRRKIEPDPTKPAVIRTIRGGGYLFSPAGDKALSVCPLSRPRPDCLQGNERSPAPFSGTFRLLRIFRILTIIEIARLFAPNVSSPAPRRNNSPAHETIFRFCVQTSRNVR